MSNKKNTTNIAVPSTATSSNVNASKESSSNEKESLRDFINYIASVSNESLDSLSINGTDPTIIMTINLANKDKWYAQNKSDILKYLDEYLNKKFKEPRVNESVESDCSKFLIGIRATIKYDNATVYDADSKSSDNIIGITLNNVTDFGKEDKSVYDFIPGEDVVLDRENARKFWMGIGSLNSIRNLDDKYSIVYGDIPKIVGKQNTDMLMELVNVGTMVMYAKKNGYSKAHFDKSLGIIYLTVPTKHETELWVKRGDNPQTLLETSTHALLSPESAEKLTSDLQQKKTTAKEPPHDNTAINFGIMSSALTPEIMENSEAFKELIKKIDSYNGKITDRLLEKWIKATYVDFVEERKQAGDTIPWNIVLGI